MTPTTFSYLPNGSILITSGTSECFLHNSALQRLVNWLNLFHESIVDGGTVNGWDVVEDVRYMSVNGFVSIITQRDWALLDPDGVKAFVAWLNEHRDVL